MAYLKSYLSKGLHQFVRDDVSRTGKKLGTGAFGTVEEVLLCGAICAGKSLHGALLQTTDIKALVESFSAECKIMSQLRHPNVVQFLGVCFFDDSSYPVLIMERLDTSLHEFLESHQGTALNIALKTSILLDIAKGLSYLHSNNPPIIHRDLTARNVLLTLANKHVKIGDLGNSRMIKQDQTLSKALTQAPGTLVYMSPEAQNPSPFYDVSLDMFSYGHLALYTLIQKFPCHLLPPTYHDPRSGKLLARSEVERRTEYISELHQAVGDKHNLWVLIRACLHNDPRKRPSAKHILAELQKEPEYDHRSAFMDYNPGMKTNPLLQAKVNLIKHGNAAVMEILTRYRTGWGKQKEEWKKYIFQMNTTHLKYFRNAEMDRVVGELCLSSVIEVKRLMQAHQFLVNVVGKGSPWTIRASSEEERICWMEAIMEGSSRDVSRNEAMGRPKEDLYNYTTMLPAGVGGHAQPGKQPYLHKDAYQTRAGDYGGNRPSEVVYAQPLKDRTALYRAVPGSQLEDNYTHLSHVEHVDAMYDTPNLPPPLYDDVIPQHAGAGVLNKRDRAPSPFPEEVYEKFQENFNDSQIGLLIEMFKNLADGGDDSKSSTSDPVYVNVGRAKEVPHIKPHPPAVQIQHAPAKYLDPDRAKEQTKLRPLHLHPSPHHTPNPSPHHTPNPSPHHTPNPSPHPSPEHARHIHMGGRKSLEHMLDQYPGLTKRSMLVTGNEDYEPRPLWAKANTHVTELAEPSDTSIFQTLYLKSSDIYVDLTSPIGEGQFGYVFKGALLRNGTQVAVKTIKEYKSEREAMLFRREMAFMSQMMHPNIVQLYGLVKEESWLVLEYLQNGDLKRFLTLNRRPIHVLVKYMIDVAMGMHYLAEKGLVHRDLAARNVMVTKDEICKVADFGLLRELPDNDEFYVSTKTDKFPLRWMAPESLLRKQYSPASDVWSFGILQWEMFNPAKVPYEQFDNTQCAAKICMGSTMAIPHQCPPTVADVMRACWNMDARKRPSFLLISIMLAKSRHV